MTRSHQQGSVLGFVLIAAALAFLLIGGAYFVRHNLTSSSDGVPIAGDSDQPQDADNEPVSEDVDPVDEPVVLPGRTDNEPQTGVDDDTPTDLPQTGPANTFFSSIMLGGMAAAGVVYKRSRDAVNAF